MVAEGDDVDAVAAELVEQVLGDAAPPAMFSPLAITRSTCRVRTSSGQLAVDDHPAGPADDVAEGEDTNGCCGHSVSIEVPVPRANDAPYRGTSAARALRPASCLRGKPEENTKARGRRSTKGNTGLLQAGCGAVLRGAPDRSDRRTRPGRATGSTFEPTDPGSASTLRTRLGSHPPSLRGPSRLRAFAFSSVRAAARRGGRGTGIPCAVQRPHEPRGAWRTPTRRGTRLHLRTVVPKGASRP